MTVQAKDAARAKRGVHAWPAVAPHWTWLALPVLLALLWSARTELAQWDEAREQVHAAAARAAARRAQDVASRLDAQFAELQYAAVGLLGHMAQPGLPDPGAVAALRRLIALRPSLAAFNVFDADGSRLLWSTQTPLPGQPLPPGAFTPLPAQPDAMLGPERRLRPDGPPVLAMRYRMREPDGAAVFVVGAPLRVDALLAAPDDSRPWSYELRDLRNAALVGLWRAGRVGFAPEVGMHLASAVPVPGYPFSLRSAWSPGLVSALYWKSAPSRLLLEAGSLLSLLLAAWGLARLLRTRENGLALRQALLDNAVVGIVQISARNQLVLSANPAFAAMLGREPEQLRGRAMRQLCADETQFARMLELMQRPPEMDPGSIQNLALSRGDGAVLLCDASCSRFAAPDGEHAIWTLVDVAQRERQAARLQRLAAHSALLAEISAAANAADQPADLFQAACESLRQRAGLRAAWIVRLDPNGAWTPLAASPGNATADATFESADGARLAAAALQAWNAGRMHFEHSSAALALRGPDGRVTALLGVACQTLGALDDDARLLLQRAAGSLERGLGRLAQRQRLADLQRLYRALMGEGDVVLQARSAQDMLDQTCLRLVQDTAFKAVWVLRPLSDGTPEVLAGSGEPLAIRQACRALVDTCWSGTEAVWNNACPLAEREVGNQGPHALLAAPVRRDGAVWAVLAVGAQRDTFDDETVRLCQRVADLLGHGLDEFDLKQNLRLLQSAEARRARIDSLTDLPNRLALEEHLPQALARARRHATQVAVGLLDLDDFKPVNDRFGHETGDALLQQLATRLRGLLRSADFVARLGGDEFVLVIEDLEPERAREQLEQALERLHGAVLTPFTIGDGINASVGMTLGAALFPRDGADGDALLRVADAAMYQAKVNKLLRPTWWQLGTQAADPPQIEHAFDPYGAEAAQLLGAAMARIRTVTERFAEAFYQELAQEYLPAAILNNLGDVERENLQHSQATHLEFLLHPDSTQQAVVRRGEQLGVVHALVGLDAPTMVRAYALYRELFGSQLMLEPIGARTRWRLLAAAEKRLQDDMQAQLRTMQNTLQLYQQSVFAALPAPGALWADAARAGLDMLGALPGIQGVLLMRLDAHGALTVERSAGPSAEGIALVLQQPGSQAVIDPASPRGQGLSAVAWRTRQPQSSASYARDPRYAFWRDTARRLGVRSTLSVPVLDPAGHVVAALSFFGAFPNQFEAPWMLQFAQGLQRRWADVWQRCSTPVASNVLPERLAQAYRQQVFAGGLCMFMQPLVDLRTGRPDKLEALARLRLEDGSLVAPAVFLPLLGDVELDRVFRIGLDQALQTLAELDAQGLRVGVSVNLSPSTLLDPDCPGWVEQALRRHGIAPQRLCLELLETQRLQQSEQAEAASELVRLGVRLAMDDLGSGYSSLKRLSALPFDVIKIDQDLFRHLYANPLDTLRLIATLIELGRRLDRELVAEGLEDAGMIEAAVQLGATHGQGYALARPMPTAQVADWLRNFHLAATPARVDTALGALARHAGFLPIDAGADGGLQSCPVTAWLKRQDLDAGAAAQWHARLHAQGGDEQARRAWNDWLQDRVRAAAAESARHASDADAVVVSGVSGVSV